MKKMIGSRVFSFILGALIFSGMTVFAYSISSKDISFTPSDSNWEVDNVEDAMNSLYENASGYKYQDFLNNASSYHSVIAGSSLSVLSPATKSGSVVTIPAGGWQYGPYISLSSGCYRVMVFGSNLDNNGLTYKVSYNDGNGVLTLLNHFKTDSVSSYDILVDSNITRVEFLVINSSTSNEVSTVNNIVLFKLKSCNSLQK